MTPSRVVACDCPSATRARPRPLPPAPAARSRRLRLGLARARRAHRASRSRSKIVPREGKRASRAAREMEAASRLRHERCVRAYDFGGDDGHVYIAYEYVQGRTLREALRAATLDRRGSGRGRRTDARRARARAPRAESSTATSSRRTCSSRTPDDRLDQAARLRSRPVRRGGHAHRRRRRARHARLHRAGAAARRRGVDGERRLGGRRHPLGGARRQPSLLGRAAAAGRGDDRGRRAAAHGATPGSAASACSPPSTRALAIEPARRPRAGERLAADSARHSSHRSIRATTYAGRARPRSPEPVAQAGPARRLRQPRKLASRRRPPPRGARAPAGLAGLATVVGGSLLPFWTPGCSPLLAVARRWRRSERPRLGLAIALFAPVFPLGNVAQARRRRLRASSRSPGSRSAGATRGQVSRSWPARSSRRSGCSRSCRSPSSPLAAGWRRGLHAALGVCAAAAVVAGSARQPAAPGRRPRRRTSGSPRPTHPPTSSRRSARCSRQSGDRDRRRSCSGSPRRSSPAARDRGRVGIAALVRRRGRPDPRRRPRLWRRRRSSSEGGPSAER